MKVRVAVVADTPQLDDAWLLLTGVHPVSGAHDASDGEVVVELDEVSACTW